MSPSIPVSRSRNARKGPELSEYNSFDVHGPKSAASSVDSFTSYLLSDLCNASNSICETSSATILTIARPKSSSNTTCGKGSAV